MLSVTWLESNAGTILLPCTLGAFSGRVVLFRAEDQATPMHEDPQLGWGPWASQGIDVHEVPGSHLTMFQSPQVEQLIELLNPYLESVAKD